MLGYDLKYTGKRICARSGCRNYTQRRANQACNYCCDDCAEADQFKTQIEQERTVQFEIRLFN
jgi:hypothetical protein